MSIEVNGQIISHESIREEMMRLHPEGADALRSLPLEDRMQLREAAVDSLIEQILLSQEANRLGVMPSRNDLRDGCARLAPRMDGQPGCRAGVDSEAAERAVARQLVAERVIEHWSRLVEPPSRSAIAGYYRKNRARFWTAEMIRAAHIVRYVEGRNPAEEEALLEHLRRRLICRERFTDVATQYSDCPENGGDLGYFPRGVMVEEFDAVVFAAPLNELTSVFHTRFGFHVALISDRKAEGIKTLDEVAPEISRILVTQKVDIEVGKQLALLRRSANIQGTA